MPKIGYNLALQLAEERRGQHRFRSHVALNVRIANHHDVSLCRSMHCGTHYDHSEPRFLRRIGWCT